MNTSGVVVHPWTESRPPTEAALRRQLEAEGLRPYVWDNEPGEVYAAHTHPYHKVIIVLEGAILFGLPDEGRDVRLTPGDRLDLPAGIAHHATVGLDGVVCMEAHTYYA